ncbi:UbiA family prenyltransferase [Trinickia terrae]|uniref:UbiA family prenyltransferase n=1 Tax=Trinickia terrae TaxID=2571161 RepID=UPI00146C9F09|nr:UbiA family prenyltransferase [Trinickia terrae]
MTDLLKQIRLELRIAYRFVRSDLWTTIYPGAAVSVSALLHASAINAAEVERLLVAIVQICLLFYGVALSEQWRAEEEDRLNKPWRPLAAGMVTLSQLRIRCFAIWLTILLLTYALGTIWWAVAVLTVSLLHAHLGLSRQWWAKSVLPPLALLSMMAAQWQAMAPMSFEIWRWGAWMLGMTVMTIAVQDLRDLDGDRAVGRRTFPMVFGESFARVLFAIAFVSLLLPEFLLMRVSRHTPPQVDVCFIVSVLLSLILAWRVINRHGRAEDHRTYRVWEYWFAAMFVSMGFCI